MLKKDGAIFIINLGLFVIILNATSNVIYTSVLIICLILSYLFFKQTYSKNNILTVYKYKIVNIHGLTAFSMLSLQLSGTWIYLESIERTYLIIFCIIQLLSIKLLRTSSVF
jgi:hypothetical protein